MNAMDSARTMPSHARRGLRSLAVAAAVVALVGLPRSTAAKTSATQTHPTPQAAQPSSDQELLKQIADLRAQVARLQALVEKQQPPAPKAASPMGGGSEMGMMDMMQMMQKMQAMQKGEMAGMSGGAMGGGMQAGGMGKGEMGMPPPEMMMEMGGMSSQPKTGGMQMGGGAGQPNAAQPAATTSISALPGVPGASHLYHIGATGFFLDQAQLKLTPAQQASLNQIKERAVLARASADRNVEQAEQELFALTGADQPDAAKIQAKLQQIEQLRTAQRLAFITAVGEATRVLTAEQRNVVLGVK